MSREIIKKNLFYFSLLLALALSQISQAAPIITVEIKDHLFYPSEFSVPANTKVKLLIINNDPTPEEFESYELNREKVIIGNSKAVIFIGPLSPGTYPFFGEFYPKTAQGKIFVN
jgi:hypothetical protein